MNTLPTTDQEEQYHQQWCTVLCLWKVFKYFELPGGPTVNVWDTADDIVCKYGDL